MVYYSTNYFKLSFVLIGGNKLIINKIILCIIDLYVAASRPYTQANNHCSGEKGQWGRDSPTKTGISPSNIFY